jgi:hypothetical protein
VVVLHKNLPSFPSDSRLIQTVKWLSVSNV